MPKSQNIEKKIEKAVRKALYQFGLVENLEKVAVALSGGKDSLSLLYMLNAISGKGFPKLDITAIHITGSVSCGPAIHQKQLQDFCESCNAHFIVKEMTLPLEQLECYSCSRIRRKLLFNASKEAGISHIAFGHHQDDNAQTLLLNLCQKGEFAGMLPKIPMHKYGITIIRPLIFVSERDTALFIQNKGLMRHTCQCPHGQKSTRKKGRSFFDRNRASFPLYQEKSF